MSAHPWGLHTLRELVLGWRRGWCGVGVGGGRGPVCPASLPSQALKEGGRLVRVFRLCLSESIGGGLTNGRCAHAPCPAPGLGEAKEGVSLMGCVHTLPTPLLAWARLVQEGLTDVAPRPAPGLGKAVELVHTQSGEPLEGLRPEVAGCLVSFGLLSAPLLEPPRAPWSLQAGVRH